MSSEKAVLRRELLSLRKSLPKATLCYDSLLSIPEFKAAKTVFCYVSAKGEVDTTKLLSDIAKEKVLTVPYCIDTRGNMIAVRTNDVSDLVEGHFGIPEPKNPIEFPKKEIDFVIVPAIAFSKDGYRLGYGKGYYDRFLSDITPYKLGVCKKELLLENLPHDEYDVRVDRILVI